MITRFMAILFTLLGTCGIAVAQVSLEQAPVTPAYTAGASFDISLTLGLTTSEQINAVGIEQTLPSGWSFASLVSGTVPEVSPNNGETGLIEFAWFPVPDSFPVTFVYRVNIAANATGTLSLLGKAIALLDTSGEVSATQSILIPRQGDGPFHSADVDFSNTIQLTELLRLIQFYNIGGFHCADFPGDTEDGYVPAVLGNKACTPHNSDYMPQDWRVDLSELLRAIQFYNSGGVIACPDQETEDGYCPGT